VSRSTHSPARERYASLWIGLERPLRALEQLAGEPERLDEEGDALAHLQLALHESTELAESIAPARGAVPLHRELAAALADARDLTDEVAAAVEAGEAEAALPLVWEWRGALFRIRLARLRLSRPDGVLPSEPPRAGDAFLLGAVVLAFALGAVTVLIAALLGAWP
jgi:hypothetical protein